MADPKLINPFYDIEKKEHRESHFFFLEHILKARADLSLESGRHDYDQEVNVYVAGLLNSLIRSESFLQQKPYISPFDADVRAWLDRNPGMRNQYLVYRDNADLSLVLLGMFLGHLHPGSYQHLVMPESDDQGRVALYYELAASALAHLHGANAALVSVFTGIAENVPEIVQILRRAARSYFDLLERISDGSFYHLEKEIDKQKERGGYESKLDEFLKLYARYKENPSEELRGQVLRTAEELKKLDENFRFDSAKL